ncbi:MAG: YkvA family protein [Chloroflexota bacterium]|nr:YkvA family protein [Chloroflexota bacterium]
MAKKTLMRRDPQLGIEPFSEAEIQGRAPDWYDLWRERIRNWIMRGADEQIARIVLLVPDLLLLVVRLARDQRVPFLLKAQLLLAAAYVISPIDLMPEAVLSVLGLADDAGVLALVLMFISGMRGVDEQILSDNWSGSGNVQQVIGGLHQQVVDNADKLFSPVVWAKMRARFGQSPKGIGRTPKRRLPRLKLRGKAASARREGDDHAARLA